MTTYVRFTPIYSNGRTGSTQECILPGILTDVDVVNYLIETVQDFVGIRIDRIETNQQSFMIN